MGAVRPPGVEAPPGGADALALSPSPEWKHSPPLTVAAAEAAFAHDRSFTVGVEEELMLVDPESLELDPCAGEVVGALGEERFVEELRPSQLEIVTGVCASPAAASAELAAARRALVDALDGRVRILAAGTHPFSTYRGEITRGERYRAIADEYTWAAQRSLACGLHVHVAIAGAERALAVYNALRSYLPELAALGANSAYFEGRDTGMSSIRPKLNEAFPRSGVPPAFGSWDEVVRFVDWGRRGGLFPDATHFWWDLRPHLAFGTLEIRVVDTQTRLSDAAAIVTVVQGLVGHLAARFDAAEPLAVHETHWIAENAWRAHRYGVRGWLLDLDTGRPEPTRERLERLLTDLEPYAERVRFREQLADARTLLAGNGSDRQRYVFERAGARGLTRWLADETEASALDA